IYRSTTCTECDHDSLNHRGRGTLDGYSRRFQLTEAGPVSLDLGLGGVLSLCLHFPGNCIRRRRPLETVWFPIHHHNTSTVAGERYSDAPFRSSILAGSSLEAARYSNRKSLCIVKVTLGSGAALTSPLFPLTQTRLVKTRQDQNTSKKSSHNTLSDFCDLWEPRPPNARPQWQGPQPLPFRFSLNRKRGRVCWGTLLDRACPMPPHNMVRCSFPTYREPQPFIQTPCWIHF